MPLSISSRLALSYHEAINRESSRLFEAQKINVEIFYTYIRNQVPEAESAIDIHTCRVRTLDELNIYLQQHPGPKEYSIYLIPQLFSWGKLQITLEAFQRIYTVKCIFPNILHVLQEFGSKTCDGLPRNCSFQSYRSDYQLRTYEFCYTNRFVEMNGRKQGDPWSLRQTGVYQQVNFDTGYSNCIILQMSKSVRKRFDWIVKEHGPGYFSELHHIMQLHLLILLSTADNWGEYIAHIYLKLKDMNEKACFSNVENRSTPDYALAFPDIQALHKLKDKVLTISLVLDSCLEVADRLAAFCWQLEDQDILPHAGSAVASFKAYADDIKTHQRKIAVILQSLDGTANVLSKILEFRNSQTLCAINQATAKNMDTLRDIAIDVGKENKSMSAMAAQTQKDSKSLKALTTVATVFLPPTLLATICSSSLVELRQSPGNNNDTYLVVTKQIWIYILLSLGATMLTWVCIQLVEYRWLRAAKIRCNSQSA